jgi:hypothetical protein
MNSDPGVGIVGVDPQDRERETRHDVLEGLKDPPGGLVPHRPVHRPPGRNIGDSQRETELARSEAALVAD